MIDKEQRWIGTCRKYDPQGNLIAEYRYLEILYEIGGRKLEEQFYLQDGRPDYRYVYEYDAKGILIEKRMLLGKDLPYRRLLFFYRAGKVHSIIWFNEQGETETQETFDYAEDGKTAVSIRENIGEWVHEWDDHGREVMVSGFTYSDAIETKTRYEYDEIGHLLRMERTHLSRCVVRFVRADGPQTSA